MKLWRRRVLLWVVVGVAALGGITWAAIMYAGDVRSISLLGLSFQYRAVALSKLGIAESALKAPCSSDDLAVFQLGDDGKPLCLAKTAAIDNAADCDPVQHHLILPTYVVPWNDLLEVKLAVTRPNVSAIASAIEDFDGRNSLMRDVVGTKQVSATQCGGYGLIEIRQHDFYFNR